MTWGEQNTQADAIRQMDYAIAEGVNFFDTAELYAIPPKAETYGKTETIIGNWLQQTGNRDKIILATKVCGPTAWVPHIRKGEARLDKKNIITACEDSLRRLQTDYIDLYQIHWPDRNTNYFGKLGYQHQPDDVATPIEESLEALAELVKTGKVRHIGISNETPWGLMQYLKYAENNDMPRICSIQNPYNLLNRSFEVGLAEIACREQVGLLAYSPLAFAVLSGKYLHGQKPTGSRLTLFEHYTRYSSDQAKLATAAYVNLAKDHGLSPAQMALAFIHRQPFVTSVIVGATNIEQLASNITSIELELSEGCISDIENIHQNQPNPCP